MAGDSIINLVLIALAALSLVMAIFAPVLVPIVAPGFDAPTPSSRSG